MAHVFISYVHEEKDSKTVERLARALEQRGIKVWLDKKDIKPGHFWKDAIREAIVRGDYFIICFSQAYHKRISTYVNEELILAIEELRKRPIDRAWFIPVLLDECDVPDRDIGAGKTLRDIQYQSLYEDWETAIERLASTILPKNTDQQKDWSSPRFREDAWYLPDEPLLGFVEIPAGSFWMGSDDDDRETNYDEKPKHQVELPAYYIARYPVTVAQFTAFVKDTNYKQADSRCLEGILDHPVVYVTWRDGMAYCRWLDEALHRGKNVTQALRTLLEGNPILHVNLPSEAQWEKAARGTDGRKYPWGNVFDPKNSNTYVSMIGGTSVVGSYGGGASPYGILDMSGNVWEWTRSRYVLYPYHSRDGREDLSGNDKRTLRGGYLHYYHGYARCSTRMEGFSMGSRFDFIGFRLAAFPFL